MLPNRLEQQAGVHQHRLIAKTRYGPAIRRQPGVALGVGLDPQIVDAAVKLDDQADRRAGEVGSVGAKR
jgi:hypothetical protein